MKITNIRPLKIEKERHRAVMYLAQHRIEGTVHLPMGGRVSDFINYNLSDGPFIPLTGVSVYSAAGGDPLFQTDFLAVHRNHIQFMTIEKELPAKG